MSITPGTIWNSTGGLTLNVSPATAGDLLLLTISTQGTPSGVTVSGGGVNTWNLPVSYQDTTTGTYISLWTGTVSNTGASVITAANITTLGSTAMHAQEFSDSNPGYVWTVTSVSNAPGASGASTGSGLNFNYPALNAAATGDNLYAGYAFSVFGSMTGGSTPGYTYAPSNFNSRETCTNPALAGTGNPATTQTNTGAYDAIAAVITAAPGNSRSWSLPLFTGRT